VVIFFLSLEHYALECFEIEVIKNMFNKTGSRYIFEKWWEIRDRVFLVNNYTPSNSISLTNIFITKSEIRVIIDKVRPSEQIKKDIDSWILNRENDIKELRKDVRNGKQLSKVKLEKYEKYFKINKTGAAAVAFRLVNYFVDDEDVSIEVIIEGKDEKTIEWKEEQGR
jgi:hypothetical protein